MTSRIETGMRRAVLAIALSATGAAAASGFSIHASQGSVIVPGMTAFEVEERLGRPASRILYRAGDGPTWTYQIIGATPGSLFFDVDFGSDGRVVSATLRSLPGGGA